MTLLTPDVGIPADHIGNNMLQILIYVLFVLVWRSADEISGKLRAVSGTDHRRELSTLPVRPGRFGSEAPDAALACKVFRRFESAVRIRAQRIGRFARNAGLV